MVSNKLTNRRQTARKPPVCHSGPAVGSILFPPEALQLKRTPLDQKLPGITSPIIPRTGRCPPPPPDLPPRTCSITPNEISLPVGDEDALDLAACCDALPTGEEVTVDVVVDRGSLHSPSGDVTNCDESPTWTYTAPDDPGPDLVTVTFTWSDTGTCIATCTVTVEEEDEEE